MIKIEPVVNKKMLDDAINAYPDECCGFLFGTEENEERVISDILVVNNSKEGDKKRSFEISPKDYLKAERYAEQNNFLLLGVYHSHPDHPAIPSEHDRISAQPYFSYVIVSVLKGTETKVSSWGLNDECQFEEEKLSIQVLFNHKINKS